MTKKILIGLIILGAAASFAVAGGDLSGQATVIDGDTIEIHGQRIRIWGIDAFGSSQLCERDGKPWRCGQAAANALGGWVGQRTVTCTPKDVDRYGRTVAKCVVAGADMGGWLVLNGWALDWPRYSGGAYANQERQAKATKAGAWAGTFDQPWDWRQSGSPRQ